nr:antibiotic biosynthesis monooxygenase [Agromyces bauzanensis]
MFIEMSIHVPNPGFERELLDSMNRVRLAALGTPGLVQIGPWREDGGGRIVGIAMWESRAHWEKAHASLAAAAEADDPDGRRHARPPERILLEDAWVLPPDDMVD